MTTPRIDASNERGGTSRSAPGPTLFLLEHLGYIIEALAEDLPSEAKQELARLTHDLDTAKYQCLEPGLRKAALDSIESASHTLQHDGEFRVRHAAVALSIINRLLWRWQLEQ